MRDSVTLPFSFVFSRSLFGGNLVFRAVGEYAKQHASEDTEDSIGTYMWWSIGKIAHHQPIGGGVRRDSM
jgi:hypothetical protein